MSMITTNAECITIEVILLFLCVFFGCSDRGLRFGNISRAQPKVNVFKPYMWAKTGMCY